MPDGAGPDVLAQTTAKQHRVSDPALSAWVSANAGAGKTHVLIQRVTRLLLAGCQPNRIVCITYTKAAAAEMADRLFGRLSAWALADDEKLRADLADVVGEDAARAALLPDARLLFARALETPGGLKIQTIHSFCEMVLRRFPAEAGLLPGFAVLEDADARALQREVIEGVAVEALADDPLLLADLDLVGSVLRPDAGEGGFQRTLQDVLGEMAAKGRLVAEAHEKAGGVVGWTGRLYRRHGLVPGTTEAELSESLREQVDLQLLRDVELLWAARTTAKGTPSNAGKFATKVAHALSAGLTIDALSRLVLGSDNEFLKNDAQGRGGPGDKGAYDLIDGFAGRWQPVRTAIIEAVERRRALSFCAFNAAIHRIAAEVHRRYAAAKQERSLLDFDDLIIRTDALMRDTSNAWVLYKLDQGIDHVLLDEAQDTGAEQWDVIWRLTEEFYAQEGTERPRTLFVVGDEKQSIYSFQGADAVLFDQKREAQKVRAERHGFAGDTFALSFRSTPPILAFVDQALRADDDLLVRGGFARHESRFPGAYGSVELWAPVAKDEEAETSGAWDAPIDEAGAADPNRRLAETICERIEAWLGGDEPLLHAGRRVRPADIMILFQRRGPSFHEMTQALSRRGIPTAGADRVRLKDDVAVRDLIALLRFCVNESDCLSLAELLKSPFWRVEEEELFILAHGREGRLWAAVRARAEAAEADDPLGRKCVSAKREIEVARRIGREEGTFALLNHILDASRDHDGLTGRQRIARRLGEVPREALNELLSAALAFEHSHPRSLEGFLAQLEDDAGEVKKEQGGEQGPGGGTVRVMTAHGAKGLQAPIVILADATYCKERSQTFRNGSLLPAGEDDGSALPGDLLCLPRSAQRTPVCEAAIDLAERARLAEYRRLFYVAATRAEERLIVCGVETRALKKVRDGKDAPPCEEADWHTLASRAMERLGDRVARTKGTGGAEVLCFAEGEPTVGRGERAETRPQAAKPAPPAWLSEDASVERAERVRTPTALNADEEDAEDDPDASTDVASAYPPRPPGAANSYLRGTAIHALLERLPDLRPERRRVQGYALAQRFAAGAPPGSAEAWLAEALSVLSDARFADVFAPGSRAEVPVIGRIAGRSWSGVIDRLVVKDDCVLVVDYKSNRPPPAAPAGVQADYLDQLAAYAALASRAFGGRPVSCALLWTYAPRLMPIPASLLNGRLG